MNDEAYEAIRARIRPLMEAWVQHLRLQGWHFVYVWDRTSPNGMHGQHGDHDGGTPIMEVESDWRYLQAKITVYTLPIHEMDVSDEELEFAVIHELIHVWVCEMRTYPRTEEQYDHEERVVTQLTRAILQVKHDFSPEAVCEPEREYPGYDG